MNKPQDAYQRLGWRFWLLWTAGSALAMLVMFMTGFFLVGLVVETLTSRPAETVFDEEGAAFVIGLSVVFTLCGAGIGLVQWLLLRRRIPHAGSWVWGSALGFAVLALLYFALYDRIPELASEVVHNGAGGLVAGAIQWRILRRQTAQAGCWLAASSLGLILAGLINLLLGTGPVAMLTGIAAMAAVTGLALIWLLNRPILYAGAPEPA
jgi:hypothetical protein